MFADHAEATTPAAQASLRHISTRVSPLGPLSRQPIEWNPTEPFAAALQQIRTAVVITDPNIDDNPIVFANRAFCRLTGYRLEEILGRNCRFLQGPETDPATAAEIFEAVEAGTAVEVDIRNYRKSGRAFWNRVWIEPIHDINGTVVYFVGNHADVTDERERHGRGAADEVTALLERRSHELHQVNATLRAEVEERQRLETLLQQLQRMESIGRLTGGIAHDFNNLLGGLIGSLELLQRSLATGRPDGLERYAAAAVASAQRAASLTRQLLDHARHRPPQTERTDVNRLLAGMRDLLQRTLGPSIDIDMQLPTGVAATMCDPGLLESAILNLAINARDAMPGGGRLTMVTAIGASETTSVPDQRSSQYVTISVTDTGIGMTEAVVARALEPLFTTKPAGEGTGLGLAMVHRFVTQYDGHMNIRSVAGAGTTVTLALPKCLDTPEHAPAEALHSDATTQPAPAAGTVLLVDDEATFRMVIDETLRGLGYTTIEASDGQAALRALQSSSRIDLLVTDIGLPGMDGRALADAARQVRPDLPILFITGYTIDSASDGEMAKSGTRLLAKPFTLPTFEQTVSDMLDAAPCPASATGSSGDRPL
ncbi:MAG TPA: PAS domain-containing protein [Rhodopila sp.]